MKPVWTIYIPGLDSRTAMREKLVAELRRQIAECDAEKRVELLVESDAGIVAPKRNRLLAAAQGEYVSNFDDDDWPAPYYVSACLAAMKDRPDVVTFMLRMVVKGQLREYWTFRLAHKNDWEPLGEYAGKANWGFSANHLCPTKTEIARRSFFPPVGHGCDQVWYKILLLLDVRKTEFFVPTVLYTYRYSSALTATQTAAAHATCRRVWGDAQVIWQRRDTGDVVYAPPGEYRRFKDRHGAEIEISLSDLVPLGQVRIG